MAALTLLFGVFGAISAARRSGRARAMGQPTGRYWRAFGGTLLAGWLLGIALALIMVAAAAAGTGTAMDARELERSIVQEGQFGGDAGGAFASGAACTEVKVAVDGSGTYRCLVDFTDGARRVYGVTVTPDGNWVTDARS